MPVSAPLGAANLTLEESALIDSFLTRRSELDFDVRVRMADQIFQRLKPKLTLPADSALSVEKILEGLAYERRATGGYGWFPRYFFFFYRADGIIGRDYLASNRLCLSRN